MSRYTPTEKPFAATSQPEGVDENETRPPAGSRDAAALVAELREYLAHFISAKFDAIKASAKNVAIYALLGLVGLIAAATILITATVLLLIGMADGIGAIFDRPFVGKLIVGALVLGAIFGGGLFFLKRRSAAAHRQTVAKYEAMQQRERTQFGRDVEHFD